jgi:hypothetical protein
VIAGSGRARGCELRPLLRTVLIAFGFLVSSAASELELISVKRIWNEAPHSAFGDLIRFDNQWFCVFREGKWHVARPGEEDDGKLRVISSKDGEQWKSAALIAEPGTDLRDPHLSITADGRLMIVAGGSEYPEGKYAGRQPRVMFSKNGTAWSAPQRVLERGHWLWRVTWHKGRAYGVSKYGSPSKELPEDPRRNNLVTSTDGVQWQTITELKVPGGDETTLRFSGDRLVALMRRTWEDGNIAWTGSSAPPYKEWQWKPSGVFMGGPNFVVLKEDRMVAGGRVLSGGDAKSPKTMLGMLTPGAFAPALTLPSGGDNSYPGFVFHDGLLWTMYYSSHEGKTGIYLAKVRVTDSK